MRADRRVLRGLLMFAECLPALLLAVAILLLCVPLATGSPVPQRKLTNIEFCVDCSGSMTAAFGEGTRYDASMAAIREFLDFREGDAFGLTFFASDVVRWCPLTRDTSAFACALPFMKPDSQRAIGGGTMIGRALINCRRVLEEQASGDRMIILVSDGQSSDLLNGANEERARELQQALKGLPTWLGVLCRLNPATYGVDLARRTLLGSGFALTIGDWVVPVWFDVAVILGIGTAMLAVAVRLFNTIE